METLTAAEAAQNLLTLVALAQEESRQFRITAEEGNVVLLSEESYQNLIVTLELLSTPGLMKGIRLFNANLSSCRSNEVQFTAEHAENAEKGASDATAAAIMNF
jgi:antitoxin YefM